MKRLIAGILALVLVLSLAACDLSTLLGKKPEGTQPPETNPTNSKPIETKPIETQPTEPEVPAVVPLEVLTSNQYISEWTDSYIRLADVTWMSVALSQKSAEEYPALAKAVEDYCVEDAIFAEEMLQDMLPGAREQAEYMGNDFYGYSYEVNCSIQRADSRLLSVRFDYDAYTGGMRPYFGTTVWNLDSATGKPLALSQVVTDWKQLPQLLVQALEEKYTELYEETFADMNRILQGYSEEAYTWTLGYQGITFYFGTSEIAPTAAGALEATLWFDQYPELFAEEYTQIPEGGYAIYLPEYSWITVDLNPGDNTRDKVYVGLDDEGSLCVAKNETFVEDDDYFAYYADAYLVTPDNKNFYLYVDSSAENDYSTFRVYDMTGEEPRCIALLEGAGYSGVWDDHYILGPNWFTSVFNDPGHFLLSAHLDILGTMSGTRVFHMDPETGLPIAEQDYYDLPQERDPLVTKRSITVKQLPGEKDMEIPAGTQLWFLRTNGKNYVDMILKDGRQCRIYVTYRDWQGYVNGIPEDECFEGIMYAG